MRDGTQAGDDPFEHEVRQHQRIAARQDDIADLRVGGDVVDAVLDVLHVDLAGIADLALPRAEAAVHRALARRQEQHTVRIAVYDAGDGAVRIFRQRVLRQPVFLQLLGIRNALEPDGIAGVPDQTEIVRIDANVKETDSACWRVPC